MITKEEAIARIVDVYARFDRACENAADDTWRKQPAPGHWSPADVCEHVTLAHALLHKLFTKRLLETRIAPGSAEVVEWAKAAPDDLRDYGTKHQIFGLLDGVQWLYVAAHMERHRAQLVGLARG